MVYNSLFREEDFPNGQVYSVRKNGLVGWFYPYSEYMPYEGTLESVLSDLEFMKGIDTSEMDSRQRIIWHAPRIIRGVLDYKANVIYFNDSKHNAPELVLTAAQAVLDIYANPLRISQAVREIRDYFSSNDVFNGILDTPIKQKSDDITFESTSPRYSNHAVNCLLNKFKGKDLCFVITAHGGVPAGLDVFLRYQSSSDNGDSIVYPVRYSTDKFEDINPRLTKAEIDYLKDTRKNRPVIIFDEDIASGTTIQGMKSFFSNRIFPKKKIFIMANQEGEQEIMGKLNGFEWKTS
ncbi:hypothetical protein HYT23_00405 [Candidatus Pacearchaeota archaeon]|nr:hypothetical protein [Candidatus Pacearchaeota archaeon]